MRNQTPSSFSTILTGINMVRSAATIIITAIHAIVSVVCSSCNAGLAGI